MRSATHPSASSLSLPLRVARRHNNHVDHSENAPKLEEYRLEGERLPILLEARPALTCHRNMATNFTYVRHLRPTG
jgi:hypothetical protein